jgi:hypothetical protein
MKRLLLLLCLPFTGFAISSSAQNEARPREFTEFRGTWLRDEASGAGSISGLPVARSLTLATNPTEISLVKDAGLPEIYRIDGSEISLMDERTGARLDISYRFTLVAEMLTLTSRRTRTERLVDGSAGRRLTDIITDAYKVDGDVLTVERQLSVLAEPPGHLLTLSNPRNNRQTLVYRRAPTGTR